MRSIIAGKPIVPAEFAGDAIIIDALLGTGVRGAVEGRLAEVIAAVNRRKPDCDIVAVDIPVGPASRHGRSSPARS